jgi:hypothetical protein
VYAPGHTASNGAIFKLNLAEILFCAVRMAGFGSADPCGIAIAGATPLTYSAMA